MIRCSNEKHFITVHEKKKQIKLIKLATLMSQFDCYINRFYFGNLAFFPIKRNKINQ